MIDLSAVGKRIILRQGRPIVHENGFLQYPLTPTGSIRLHVWPDRSLTKQATSSPIHDHRFGFTSTVLHGTLDHIVYRPYRADGPYLIANVVHGKLVIPTEHFVSVRVQAHEIIRTGKTYEFKPAQFHDSRGRGLTVTIMEKTVSLETHTVRVICHREEPPDNTFSRVDANDLNRLWEILDDVVQTGCLA